MKKKDSKNFKGVKPGTASSSKNVGLSDPKFIERVNRLDKLMTTMSKTPSGAPPGLVMARVGEGGTLEQVGREADNAWAGVKNIMRLLNVESKYVHFHNSNNINYTGVLISDVAALIAQGVTVNQRTGDSLKINRFRMKGSISFQGAPTEVTLVVGRSKDGVPAAADVFAMSGATSADAGNSYMFPNTDKAVEWIQARHFAVDTYNGIHKFEIDLKLNHHVNYSPASTTVLSGDLWVYAISGLNATMPIVRYAALVEYVDN